MDYYLVAGKIVFGKQFGPKETENGFFLEGFGPQTHVRRFTQTTSCLNMQGGWFVLLIPIVESPTLVTTPGAQQFRVPVESCITQLTSANITEIPKAHPIAGGDVLTLQITFPMMSSMKVCLQPSAIVASMILNPAGLVAQPEAKQGWFDGKTEVYDMSSRYVVDRSKTPKQVDLQCLFVCTFRAKGLNIADVRDTSMSQSQYLRLVAHMKKCCTPLRQAIRVQKELLPISMEELRKYDQEVRNLAYDRLQAYHNTDSVNPTEIGALYPVGWGGQGGNATLFFMPPHVLLQTEWGPHQYAWLNAIYQVAFRTENNGVAHNMSDATQLIVTPMQQWITKQDRLPMHAYRVLGYMCRLLANSIPYIGDVYQVTDDEIQEIETFSGGPLQKNSASDCEDSTAIVSSIFYLLKRGNYRKNHPSLLAGLPELLTLCAYLVFLPLVASTTDRFPDAPDDKAAGKGDENKVRSIQTRQRVLAAHMTPRTALWMNALGFDISQGVVCVDDGPIDNAGGHSFGVFVDVETYQVMLGRQEAPTRPCFPVMNGEGTGFGPLFSCPVDELYADDPDEQIYALRKHAFMADHHASLARLPLGPFLNGFAGKPLSIVPLFTAEGSTEVCVPFYRYISLAYLPDNANEDSAPIVARVKQDLDESTVGARATDLFDGKVFLSEEEPFTAEEVVMNQVIIKQMAKFYLPAMDPAWLQKVQARYTDAIKNTGVSQIAPDVVLDKATYIHEAYVFVMNSFLTNKTEVDLLVSELNMEPKPAGVRFWCDPILSPSSAVPDGMVNVTVDVFWKIPTTILTEITKEKCIRTVKHINKLRTLRQELREAYLTELHQD